MVPWACTPGAECEEGPQVGEGRESAEPRLWFFPQGLPGTWGKVATIEKGPDCLMLLGPTQRSQELAELQWKHKACPGEWLSWEMPSSSTLTRERLWIWPNPLPLPP